MTPKPTRNHPQTDQRTRRCLHRFVRPQPRELTFKINTSVELKAAELLCDIITQKAEAAGSTQPPTRRGKPSRSTANLGGRREK